MACTTSLLSQPGALQPFSDLVIASCGIQNLNKSYVFGFVTLTCVVVLYIYLPPHLSIPRAKCHDSSISRTLQLYQRSFSFNKKLRLLLYRFLPNMYVFLCCVQKGGTGPAATSASPILAVSEHIFDCTSIYPLHFTLCLLFHSVLFFSSG
jgi:hypothetical protein